MVDVRPDARVRVSEMRRALTPLGIRTPDGFATTADAISESYRRLEAQHGANCDVVYRVHHGFGHAQVALSVGVQKMVRSDLACAGVMFSIDTETGFSNAVLVSGAYGLGESVVQGTVNPDEFYVFKPTLATGFRPILQKKLGTKEFKLVYEDGGTRQTRSSGTRSSSSAFGSRRGARCSSPA